MDILELEEKRKLLELWAARQQANRPYNIMMQGLEQPQQAPMTEGNINWGPGIQAGVGLLDKLGRAVAPMAYPLEIEKFVNLPPEQRRIMAGKEALGLVMPLQIGPVYHGSPYRFNKFKSEAIGSGEGAQAFGYGHYFSSLEEVGKDYQKNVAKLKSPTKNEGLRSEAFTRNGVQYNRWYGDFYKWDEKLQKQVGISEKEFWAAKNEPQGYLYEATLHKGKQPGEYEYLRWDEPVSKETTNKIINQLKKEVGMSPGRDRLLKVLESYEKHFTQDQMGFVLYKKISAELAGDQQASALLKRAGIDGIKYPAGTLSGAANITIGDYSLPSTSVMRNQIKDYLSGSTSLESIKGSVERTIDWAKQGKGLKKILDDMTQIKTQLDKGNKPKHSAFNYVVFDPEDIAIEAVK